MTDDIREKAKALIKDIDDGYYDLTKLDSYRELKAALSPSREEIMRHLHNMQTEKATDKIMVNYAIRELRK